MTSIILLRVLARAHKVNVTHHFYRSACSKPVMGTVMYLYVTSCICVLRHVFVCYVMYLCVTSCICVLRHAFVCYLMYLCFRGIDFASFYDLSIEVCYCSNSVVLLLFFKLFIVNTFVHTVLFGLAV